MYLWHFGRQPLVQREDIAPLRRGHKLVGVFDAGNDRLQFEQRSYRVAGEPGIEFGSGDRGIDRHHQSRRAPFGAAASGFRWTVSQFRTRTAPTAEP